MATQESNSKVKLNGKMPLEQKGKNVSEYYTGAPKSMLEVPETCIKELKSKGLVCRWIDIPELKKNHNFHKQGWRPYKFDCLIGKDSSPFMDTGMDGFLVRATSVLAVKSEEEASKQKHYIKSRTLLQSNAVGSAEKAFRDFAKKEKAVKVHGWDDKDESETE